MSGKLISLIEYAEKNGVHPNTVREKIHRGNIPGAVKIGRNWCVPEDAPYEDHRVTSGKYLNARKNRKSEAK